LTYLNLEKIDYYVKLGVLNPAERITIKTLVDLGVVRDVQFGVKILARVRELLSRERIGSRTPSTWKSPTPARPPLIISRSRAVPFPSSSELPSS
jgi:hypothetical protein